MVRPARAISKPGSTTADFPPPQRSRGDGCTGCTIRETAAHHPPGGRCVPSARDSAWTTRQWEGHPGDRVAFVVSSEMRAWQEVEAVAANPEGVLRRLVIGRGGWFGRSRPEVREVADESLAHAVAQGTFTQWLEHNAQALSRHVGRGRPRSQRR